MDHQTAVGVFVMNMRVKILEFVSFIRRMDAYRNQEMLVGQKQYPKTVKLLIIATKINARFYKLLINIKGRRRVV